METLTHSLEQSDSDGSDFDLVVDDDSSDDDSISLLSEDTPLRDIDHHHIYAHAVPDNPDNCNQPNPQRRKPQQTQRRRRKLQTSYRRQRADQVRAVFSNPFLLRTVATATCGNCAAPSTNQLPLDITCGAMEEPVVALHQSCGLWNAFGLLQEEEEEADKMRDTDKSHLSSHHGLLHTSISSTFDTDGVDASREYIESPSRIVVAVEATAICRMDLQQQNQLQSDDAQQLGFGTGRNFCGVVHHCSNEAMEMGMAPGCRVAGIVPHSANARYVSIDYGEDDVTRNLAVVPKHLDASDICTLVAIYLPAFQALFHGRQARERYSRSSLWGKSVLVTGGASMEGQAVISLARRAGASHIFVTAPREQFELVRSLSAIPVDTHPEDWLSNLEGKMNVIVDLEFPANFERVRMSLAKKGRLVCCPRLVPSVNSSSSGSWLWGSLESVYDRYMLSTIKRASLYDFGGQFLDNEYNSHGKRDLEFLLMLLTKRIIRPKIDRYIRLHDVPQAHQELRNKSPVGAIVCEPWKDG